MLLDHICIAVRSIDGAIPKLGNTLGYRPRTGKVANTRQKVNVQFLQSPGSLDIKLIEPSGEDSPLWQFLRNGEGLHHICFMADNTSMAASELKQKGARVLASPAPGEAFDDALIAFAYIGLGVNIEIIDTERRRDLLCAKPDD